MKKIGILFGKEKTHFPPRRGERINSMKNVPGGVTGGSS